MSNVGPNPGEYIVAFGPYAHPKVVVIIIPLPPKDPPQFHLLEKDPGALTLADLNHPHKTIIKVLPEHVLTVTITPVQHRRLVVSTTQIPSRPSSAKLLTGGPKMDEIIFCNSLEQIGECAPGSDTCPDDGREYELVCKSDGQGGWVLDCQLKTYHGPPKSAERTLSEENSHAEESADKSSPDGGCCGQ